MYTKITPYLDMRNFLSRGSIHEIKGGSILM